MRVPLQERATLADGLVPGTVWLPYTAALTMRAWLGNLSLLVVVASLSGRAVLTVVGDVSRGGAGRFAVYPVVEDEKRQPEDRESVLGPQFAVVDVDIELFGEAVDRQHRELPGGWVGVGEVVAGLVQVAAAGQGQATAGAGARQQRSGEAGLRQREADAHIPATAVPVGGVDADIDRLAGVSERPDPAPDRHDTTAIRRNRVDPAADALLRFTLVHKHVRLPQGPGDDGAVQQIARPHP